MRFVAAFAACFALSCASAATSTGAKSSRASGIAWIHDDLDAARRAARASNKPIMAIVCGDWSDACRALRARMRSDPALALRKDDFVWLDVETESEMGARAVERFGVDDGAAVWVIDGDKLERRFVASDDPAAPDEPLAALEAEARSHPDRYDAHDRLARAYHREGREDDALAAIDRAAALAHGPYRIVILAKKADIALARGDRDGARAAIARALDLARPLALQGRFAALRARLEVALAEWNRSQKR